MFEVSPAAFRHQALGGGTTKHFQALTHRVTRQDSTVTFTCLSTGQDWFLLTTVMFCAFLTTLAEWRSAETPALNRTRVKSATVIMLMIMAEVLQKNPFSAKLSPWCGFRRPRTNGTALCALEIRN